jgi:hypothetical protein
VAALVGLVRSIERPRRSARIFPAAIVIGACLAAAGCGSNEEPKVRNVVKTYLAAIAHGNGAKACAQLSGEAKRRLLASTARMPRLHARDCQGVALRLGRLPGSKAFERANLKVSISGDQATAKIGSAPLAVILSKTDGHWLIDSFAPASSISP